MSQKIKIQQKILFGTRIDMIKIELRSIAFSFYLHRVMVTAVVSGVVSLHCL